MCKKEQKSRNDISCHKDFNMKLKKKQGKHKIYANCFPANETTLILEQLWRRRVRGINRFQFLPDSEYNGGRGGNYRASTVATEQVRILSLLFKNVKFLHLIGNIGKVNFFVISLVPVKNIWMRPCFF